MMALLLIAAGDVVVDHNMPEKDRVHWRDSVAWELRKAGMDMTYKGGHFPLARVENASERWFYYVRAVPDKYEVYVKHNEHGGMHQIARGTLREICAAALLYTASR